MTLRIGNSKEVCQVRPLFDNLNWETYITEKLFVLLPKYGQWANWQAASIGGWTL